MKKAHLTKRGKKPSGKYRVIYADPPQNDNDKCDSGELPPLPE